MLAERCGFAFLLFALAFSARVMFLEHGWATLMSHYPGVEYSYTDSENLFANILRWDEPQQNYKNNGLVIILSTRCAYFHIWAMCIPFFVTRSFWSYVKDVFFFRRGPLTPLSSLIVGIVYSGLLVSIINFIRLNILYSAVNADIPWWLAHDIPNIVLGLLSLGLSIEYFRRKSRLAQQTRA